MPRYTTKAYWDGEEVECGPLPGDNGMTVFEPEETTTEAGLLDSNGLPIYRVHERRRIGF